MSLENTLSCLKKLELLKDRIKPLKLIKSEYINELEFQEKNYIYNGQIIPNRVIQNKTVFKIIELDPIWFLNGFCVTVENNLVKRVIVFGYHPNKDWKTGNFCLPEHKLNIKYTKSYEKMLINTLKTFYLDDCYVKPLDKQIIII
jgi:hypothetical protein